jgi:hypothetical protein
MCVPEFVQVSCRNSSTRIWITIRVILRAPIDGRHTHTYSDDVCVCRSYYNDAVEWAPPAISLLIRLNAGVYQMSTFKKSVGRV